MKKKQITGILILIMVLLMCQLLIAEPSGQRLRALADPLGILFGYASKSNFNSMSDSSAYKEVARTEFNIMTCENAMKIDALEPNQNSFNFTPADAHVRFARDNGMEIHGHTLVWHSQVPNWMRNINNRSSLISAMNNHIDKVLEHYRGQILVWDVVNEAFNEDGSFRNSFWNYVIGPEYIDLAFQRARQADPTTKLIINDYNFAELAAKSTGAYNLIQSMINRGIPIDGIGFQMHLTADGIDYDSFSRNMERFAALGMEIYITELDVRIPPNPSQSDLQNQANIYREVMERCLAQPACKVVQVWGIPDKYSWVPSVFPNTGAPLLFDDNYNAKPAYYAVQDVLANSSSPQPTPQQGLPGDVNEDNVVDIVDALLIAQWYVQLYPPVFNEDNADVDCNNEIDIVDALLIAQYYVDLIKSLDC